MFNDNPKSRHATIRAGMKAAREFTRAMWTDESLYNRPARMDIYDAATNLSEYIAEGLEVPDILTPALYATLWNHLCLAAKFA